MLNTRKIFGLLGAALGGAIWLSWPSPIPRTGAPMSQDAYVWQRSWQSPVLSAIARHSGDFTNLVVLSAEVTWDGGSPNVARSQLDYEVLRQLDRPIGIALRIGSFSGPFAKDDDRARWLANLAKTMVTEAATNRVKLSELQIDFDCATSKLGGYRRWIEAIRHRITPLPVVITALSSWLSSSAMKALVQSADGYVLQVHSLTRPKTMDDRFTLCDPKAARRAVERAARLGCPFRVALPTYSYLTAFDRDGHFIGLSAEGPSMSWPAGTGMREVRADPKAMTDLVTGWGKDRPELLHGVIWYRMPVSGDQWNWSWETLESVMNGHPPKAILRAELRRPDPGLVELDLVNEGTEDHFGSVELAVQWHGARRVASDALQGFDFEEKNTDRLLFTSRADWGRLRAGTRQTIGWIRLNQDVEVTVDFQ